MSAVDDRFLRALAFTLKWEGGYVCNPNDPGGETNFGITKAVYDAYRKDAKLPVQSIKLITANEVHDIYEDRYWIKAGCNKITDTALAISVFDFAVNGGVSRAVNMLASSPNASRYNDARLGYYARLCASNPRLKVFQKGWQNRVIDLEKYSKGMPDLLIQNMQKGNGHRMN